MVTQSQEDVLQDALLLLHGQIVKQGFVNIHAQQIQFQLIHKIFI
jgi:hypothetical protein